MRYLCLLLGLLGLLSGDVGQCWVATAIGAGLGVLSSLYGGSKASKEAKKAQRELDRRERREQAWYDRRYNEDYADTAAGQRLLTSARDLAQENFQRASGANRVIGGTGSSVAKAREQGSKVVSDTLSNIASNDVTRKTRVDELHRAAQNDISNKRIGVYDQRAQNITAAAGQASNAMMSAGALVDTKGSSKKSLSPFGDNFWDDINDVTRLEGLVKK